MAHPAEAYVTRQETRPIVMIGDVPIPIEQAPPDAPAIPGPPPVIQYVGRGVVAAWSDVWDWVKGTAAPAVGALVGDIAHLVTQILPIIEAYVGQQLKAVSGFINDLWDWTFASTAWIQAFMFNATVAIAGIFAYIDMIVGQLVGDIYAVVNAALPRLEALIYGAYAYADALVAGLAADIESWAVSHIYNPVMDELAKVEADVTQYTRDVVAAAVAQVVDLIHSDNALLHADIAAALAVAAATALWVKECGDPMCASLGPSTDLGKLLKAIQAAELLAIFGELATLDEAGVEERVRDAAARAAAIIAAFDHLFIGGGGSLGELIGAIGG